MIGLMIVYSIDMHNLYYDMLLSVHVSEVSVDITSRDVLQTNRTLCPLPSCPWSCEDRDPGRTWQRVLGASAF